MVEKRGEPQRLREKIRKIGREREEREGEGGEREVREGGR